MVNVFNIIIGTPLGFTMRLCLALVRDYGFSIILFTLATKLILFPLSVWVQKNSIKMIKIQPEINNLEAKYIHNKDAFYDEQIKVYKREKYNVFAGFIPLLIQIPLIIGIISVIYNPMQHLLNINTETIEIFNSTTKKIMQTEELGSSPQLRAIELMRDENNYTVYYEALANSFSGDFAVETMQKIDSFNMNFFGMNLSEMPSILKISILWLMPLLAGLSSLIMCIIQNKINVLQKEQGFIGKWGMVMFLTAFSLYFGFAVAAGVGLYWIASNVFSTVQMFILNAMYNPNKIIDYAALEESKKVLAQAKEGLPKKSSLLFDRTEEGKRERQDYKRFFQVPEDKMKVVFYSEASGFYKYYKNIINSILENSGDLIIHYVTEDPNDIVFSMNNPRLVPYFIRQAKLISLMMKLTCDIVVMTTPDLQTYHIKRSLVRKDIEYIYVDHAGTNLCMGYRPHALDYFDTIFAVSEEQAREVRAMEKYYSTPKKNILKCGYALIDDMIASYDKSKHEKNQLPVILIAPSWQNDNILDSCLDDILEKILDKDWKVIVRPHPMYIKRFPDKMNSILSRYKLKLSNTFEIQTDFSSNATVYNSDLVITDWSAIGTEFSFTTLKPTLYINTEMKILNPDYDKIGVEPYDITVRNIAGKAIQKESISNIDSIIADMLNNMEEYREIIEKERNRYYYNLGKSGEVGAKYILGRIKL